MSEPIRFTTQKKQELISCKQLGERFVEFGWMPNSPEDLGEDFIVHIYFQGRATGVTFHVQEKSVTNLHERQKGDHLVYDFRVKDLKHWEAFSLPVVLIVWDIKLREGRWALLDTVISELDQRRPKWRVNKSTARVYIPWNNTTDNAGLVRLRQSIGWHLYPLIARDKQLRMNMKLNFPDTEEGRAAWKAFECFRRGGEQATFRGRIIRELKFSKWAMPWLGEYDPDNVEVSIGPPASPKTFPVDIDIISVDGETASIPTVELRLIKSGEEVAQLSNDHQTSPLHFCFTIRKPDKYVEGSIRVNNLGSNVHLTRDVMRFLQAIATGGTLRFTFFSPDNASLAITLPPQPEKLPISECLQLIDKLCKIQDKTRQFLQVPVEGLTRADVQASYELVEIIEHGKTITKHTEITGKFKGEALDIALDVHRQAKPIHLTVSSHESYVELLGLKIQMGRMTRHISGTIGMPITGLEKAITALDPDEYLTLRFIDVEVVEIFPDWFVREAQQLSQRLVDNFGAESVYLFGSLAWSDVHAAETDIDLAVSGLPAERYLESADYLERESNFPVDLVDLSKVSDHLRQRIVTEGKLLSEREPVMALS